MNTAQVKPDPTGLPDRTESPTVTETETERSSPAPNAAQVKPEESSPNGRRRSSFSLIAIGDLFTHKAYANSCLYIGALLAIADMVSDVAVTRMFFETGQTSFAYITIACITTCLSMQALVVFQNYKNVGKRRLLRELFYVVTCTKPGIDAYRVANGVEQPAKAGIAPANELIMCRCMELFSESIPGAILQSYAILVGKDQGLSLILSLTSSVLSGSFISAAMGYEKDTDKNTRRHSPQFYGYIPEGFRSTLTITLLMWVMSACQMTGKSFACALCAVESRTTLGIFLVAEFAAYCLFLASINKDYVKTFYSTQTGPQMIQDLFYNGKDDRQKIECLTINTAYWKPIEGDVKAWIRSKLQEWQESQPEWWGDRFKLLVPKSWLNQEERSAVRESMSEEGSALYK
ncbi:hypothetical protein TrVE_jg7805 [Triparma verrucosa]|uniref:Uncharacterized protein n=1 Tax=Triparma verrucosa TaxID=1606542 RepID=A0A9W7EPJ8_9STRA|nr:hypothetical protein TrVE_jg7805 [Triparma verrucosa]